jgi:hypothetical protein
LRWRWSARSWRCVSLREVYAGDEQSCSDNAIGTRGKNRAYASSASRAARRRVSRWKTRENRSRRRNCPKYWDRYHRAPKHGEAGGLGTGLGLAIVKSIVTRHGVAYGVESDEKRTVFWFDTMSME